jgi:hypothetical protein
MPPRPNPMYTNKFISSNKNISKYNQEKTKLIIITAMI